MTDSVVWWRADADGTVHAFDKTPATTSELLAACGEEFHRWRVTRDSFGPTCAACRYAVETAR